MSVDLVLKKAKTAITLMARPLTATAGRLMQAALLEIQMGSLANANRAGALLDSEITKRNATAD